jgi:hypothetical protein
MRAALRAGEGSGAWAGSYAADGWTWVWGSRAVLARLAGALAGRTALPPLPENPYPDYAFMTYETGGASNNDPVAMPTFPFAVFNASIAFDVAPRFACAADLPPAAGGAAAAAAAAGCSSTWTGVTVAPAGADVGLFVASYTGAGARAPHEIRYTTDGSPVSGASALYAAPFAVQARDVVALANASSADQAACKAIYPDPADSWKCIFGQYAVPFIKSDFFLHAYQYDLFQLSSDTKVPVPNKTPQQLAYCEMFRNATRADFAADVVKPNGPGKNAGLLPACYKHCNTEGSSFSTLATNGVTLQDAVAAWWGAAGASSAAGAAAAVPQYIVEDCTGFSCGTDCPKV